MKEDFTSIGEILDENMDENPKYRFALKCATVFSFWGEIVGKKFTNITKPIDVKNSKLKVECKNSVVSQELSMFKSMLLKKIQAYAKPLGIEINDIIFSYKNWQTAIQKFEELEDEFLPYITNEELNSQILSEDEMNSIFESIDKLDFMPDNIKEKYYSDIIKNLKYQKFLNRHN